MFQCKAVSVAIDAIWRFMFKRIFFQVFLPFLVYLISFNCFCVFMYDKETEKLNGGSWTILIFCIVYSFLAFFWEVVQLKNEGLHYLASINGIWG